MRPIYKLDFYPTSLGNQISLLANCEELSLQALSLYPLMPRYIAAEADDTDLTPLELRQHVTV